MPRLGEETWRKRLNLVEKVYEEKTLFKKCSNVSNYSTFISGIIGCDNVEIIKIARAKVEFGLKRFFQTALGSSISL